MARCTRLIAVVVGFVFGTFPTAAQDGKELTFEPDGTDLIGDCRASIGKKQGADKWRGCTRYVETSQKVKEELLGRDLLIKCMSLDQAEQMFCYGFVQGVVMMAAGGYIHAPRFCPPPITSYQERADIVTKYLRGDDMIRYFDARYAVIRALQHVYPCNQ
jgi:hypothetical protein